MSTTPNSLARSMDQAITDIAAVAERLPGIVIIHDLQASRIAYLSPWGLSLLDKKPEEVIGMDTEEYHARYFNPEYAEHYVPKIWAMLSENTNETISFFQQVRKSPSEEWSWYTSSIKILLRNDQSVPVLSVTIAIPLESDHFFAAKAERLLEENIFLRNNLHRFAALSKREKDVLRELALGKSAADIAKALHISVATAETHRRNLKQKLHVKNSFEIAQYARAFDLI